MKKIIITILFFGILIFAMGNEKQLKNRINEVTGGNDEIVRNLDLLENYDILVQLDFLEDYGNYSENGRD